MQSATIVTTKCDSWYYKVQLRLKHATEHKGQHSKSQCIRHWSSPSKEGVYLQFEPLTIHFADTEYS